EPYFSGWVTGTIANGRLYQTSAHQLNVYKINYDCNTNGTLDEIDVIQSSVDCNNNNTPDECEMDCNGNGIPDACEHLDPLTDCNTNGVCDSAELATGLLHDVNADGRPDECYGADNFITKSFGSGEAEVGYTGDVHVGGTVTISHNMLVWVLN